MFLLSSLNRWVVVVHDKAQRNQSSKPDLRLRTRLHKQSPVQSTSGMDKILVDSSLHSSTRVYASADHRPSEQLYSATNTGGKGPKCFRRLTKTPAIARLFLLSFSMFRDRPQFEFRPHWHKLPLRSGWCAGVGVGRTLFHGLVITFRQAGPYAPKYRGCLVRHSCTL